MNLDTDAKTESCSEGASMMTNDDATAADTGCATFRPRAPEEEEATGTTTSDVDVDRNREGRECNGLESFFLRFNVRFAVGLTLPPRAATATRRRAEVSEAFATSLGLHGADIEAVSSPPPPSPAPAAATGDAATTGESPPSPPPPPRLRVRGRGEGFPFDVASFRRFGCRLRGAVDDNVGRDLPADGPPSLTLYTLTSEGGDDRGEDGDGDGDGDGGDAVAAIVVNINHALFDAITMRAVLKTFLRLLQEEPVEKEEEEEGGVTSSAVEVEVEEKARRRPVALEWGDLVRTYPPPNSSETPRFLPMPYSTPDAQPLRMSEVVGGGPCGMSENDDIIAFDGSDVVVVVDPETFRRCRSLCRARAATLTGLWMSCLSRAIAEAYFRNLTTTDDDKGVVASLEGGVARRPCRVAISVLVDLRRYFPDEMRDVLQVQSTVTVGVELSPRDVVEQSDDSVEGGERGRRTAEALLEGAVNMTSDLRERIGRGEAHRQADAMGGGAFDGGCPVAEATVELSNHGAYHTPPPLPDVGGGGRGRAGCEVELSQRFDGYRGMSVVVYSESGSDTMKAVASFGEDVCRSGALDLMNRVRSLFELVSRLEDKASTK